MNAAMTREAILEWEMRGRRMGAIRAAGTTQHEMAQRLGVSKQLVSLTVCGARTAWWARAAIAHLAGAAFEWFWGEPATPPPSDADAQTLRERAGLVYCARSAATEPIKPLLKCMNCGHRTDCGGKKCTEQS